MKKLILTAILGVVALVAIPISSASAYTGACTINGSAEFEGTLGATPKPVKYKFKSSAVSCVPLGGPTEVEVKEGEVDASCVSPILPVGDEQAELVIGENIKDGKVVVQPSENKLFLDIEGSAGGVVAVKIKEHETDLLPQAAGVAEFFTSLEEPAINCATSGVKKLEFTAAIAGTV